MKKFGLLFASLLVVTVAFGQYDSTGSTMEQPIRPPVETSWENLEIGEFSDPVPYVHQRQGDVMYYITIWRTIDLREKVNHPLYFPIEQRGSWRSLGQVILDAINLNNPEAENSLRVYTDEFCNVPMSKENIKSALVEVKTQEIINPETFEVIGTQDITNEYKSYQILSYNVKEIWFFDKQRSLLDVRILEITPIIEYEKQSEAEPVEGQEEEIVSGSIQKKRVGYILYDELRPFLAKQEMYNIKNNAQRISFDDVITWKRQFTSYVYAEQNVYSDREIREYITNSRDQKIESDRITDNIRTFEHDLWEF